MDLLNLEIFCTVAYELSITGAAKRLNRAQSNVSTRIQQLEKQLGVTLLLRDSKQIRLTREGKSFLGYCEQMLALAKEAKQALHPAEPCGELHIGSMEATAASRLPALLAGFQQRWDKVSLRVSTAPSRRLLERICDYSLDCAFIALRSEEKLSSNLMVKQAFSEQLLLIVPERYRHLKVHELTKLRLACFGEGCSYRDYAQTKVFANQSLMVQELGSYHGIIASVAAGCCVGILPKSVLDLQPQKIGLSVINLEMLNTALVWRKNNNSYALKKFTQLFDS